MKTNAARILDSLNISYELRDYEVDPNDLTAATVARKIGLPLESVFKTLLTRVDAKHPFFAVIPGDTELNLKLMAAEVGGRKAELMPLKEVEPLTGYIRGGVTVLGAKKAFPVIVHESLTLFDQVSVSAGVRGTQIILAPNDYLRAIASITEEETTIADIARPMEQPK